jgi:hypothetical protein
LRFWVLSPYNCPQHDNIVRTPYHSRISRIPWLPSNSQPQLHFFIILTSAHHSGTTSHPPPCNGHAKKQSLPKCLLMLSYWCDGFGKTSPLEAFIGKPFGKGATYEPTTKGVRVMNSVKINREREVPSSVSLLLPKLLVLIDEG